MSEAVDRLKTALADRYRIDRQLGHGGMATVYLADDLKHDRKVAIKVLKPELAAVLGAERFVQEIKTTAQLQHPHILPLFDSGQADSFLFYVMPYIQGETLRDKLNREKQLGIEESVRITTDVADALDYAHRHGVIHRDIKPENILLHDGRPMVADFGIALAVSAAAGGRMTETGLSLGTPHYMSPEQATADRDITARSDVYSLATVLYEMLAGEPPHMGNSAQQIIMKIITDVARPVSDLRRSVPPAVAAAVGKALEKLPADRFASARAFADALNGQGPAPTRGSVSGLRIAAPALARRPLVLGVVAVLLAVAAFGLGGWRAGQREVPIPVVRFQLEVPASALSSNTATGTMMAVSPDGSTVAWVAAGDAGSARLYVRRLDDGTARVVPGTDGAQQPCFSPDGRWVAYAVRDMIWKVELAGGAPVQVGATLANVVGLTWSPSGVILVGAPRGILSLPAAGGSPKLIAGADSAAGELYFVQPRALADGETVLFAIQKIGGLSESWLGVLDLGTGAVSRTDISALDPLGWVDGTLVYVTPAGALTAVAFDLGRRRRNGDPLGLGPTVRVRLAAGVSDAALSPTGTLVYQPRNPEATVGWVGAGTPFKQLLSDTLAYEFPRLSPDGRRLAVTVGSGGRSDVWVYDIASATPTRLTSTGTTNERAEWTPDGRRILYRTDRGRRTAIWWQPADMSGPAEPLLESEGHDYYEGVVTPDGSTLVYQIDDGAATQADVMYRALSGDTASRSISSTAAVEAQARVSPDGKWIAFVTDASGTSQVVVRPFPGAGGQVQVSVAGGSEPVWAPDGRRLFYRDGRRLIAANVTRTPVFAVASRTEVLADEYAFALAPHANYDVSSDGNRFLMVRSVGNSRLEVVVGWLSELRARMKATAR